MLAGVISSIRVTMHIGDTLFQNQVSIMRHQRKILLIGTVAAMHESR